MSVINRRVGIISDFNCEWFAKLLEASPTEPRLTPVLFPFAQVHQSLSLVPEDIDYAFIWTRPQAVFKNFAKAVEFCEFSKTDLMDEVEQFAKKIRDFSHHLSFCFVATWNIEEMGRSGGLLNWDCQYGLKYLNAEVNLFFARQLANCKNVAFLDSGDWLNAVGASAHNPKLYYSTKMPYSNAVLQHAVSDLKSAIHAIHSQTKKLIIVDLDDTLWGGVVGDVGQENIVLGGHHMQGEAFVDFQKVLKTLKNRGIALAIASKNNENTALAAIDTHPCMQLRRDDFVTWRINWADKAENILAIAREMNLGLDAIVFIDNDKVERERVRSALPEITVPDWPMDPLFYAHSLKQLKCFDQYSLTNEDLSKTELYIAENKRRESASVQTVEEWLADLDMQITVENMHQLNAVRIVQLFNKTNQMNLSTRRFTANTLSEWLENPHHDLWAFHVLDKFGDYGLMGILAFSVTHNTLVIEDFILSCRVMGRGVEQSMLAFAYEQARLLNAESILACYLPTAKNLPCLTFLQKSGFRSIEPHVFQWDVTNVYPLPKHIQLKRKELEFIA